LSANDDRSARSGLRANARSHVQRHQRNLESGRVATRALDEVTPTPTSASPSSIAAIAPSEDNRATDNRATTHAAESATQAPTSQERAAPPSAATADEPATKPSVAKADAVHPTPVDDARLEREMQMLAVAQRVLPTDPVRALRLARQGDREFAGSMFSAERKQIGLLALVQLGHLDEARRLGAPFLVAYPNAPWSERLRRALATGRIPAP
jgi:hypothetical protein